MVGAQRTRQVHALRVQIDAHYHAALLPHQLRHQLAHQSEADHRHHVAEFDARRAHRVHRDAAQRRKTGVLVCHSRGHARRQVPAHQNRLPVARALAAVCHPLADFEIRHGGMSRRHHARSRISQDGVLAELRADFRDGRRGSGLHCDVPDFAQVSWIIGNLGEQAVAMDAGRLGAA